MQGPARRCWSLYLFAVGLVSAGLVLLEAELER